MAQAITFRAFGAEGLSFDTHSKRLGYRKIVIQICVLLGKEGEASQIPSLALISSTPALAASRLALVAIR